MRSFFAIRLGCQVARGSTESRRRIGRRRRAVGGRCVWLGPSQGKARARGQHDDDQDATVTEPARTVTAPHGQRPSPRPRRLPHRAGRRRFKATPRPSRSPRRPRAQSESSGGIPAWAWVLIGAGAVLLVVAIFMIGRSRGTRARDATDPARPDRPARLGDAATRPAGGPDLTRRAAAGRRPIVCSKSGLRGDPARLDRVGQLFVVAVVLRRVGLGELEDRAVEGVPAAQV